MLNKLLHRKIPSTSEVFSGAVMRYKSEVIISSTITKSKNEFNWLYDYIS